MRPRSLRIHLTTAFVLLIVVIGGLIGWSAQVRTQAILHQAALDKAQLFAGHVQLEIAQRGARARGAIQLLAKMPNLGDFADASQVAVFDVLDEALHQMPFVSSVYVGWASGEFAVVNRRQGTELGGGRYTAHWRRGEESTTQMGFLDETGNLNKTGPDERLSSFDPRKRPWFQQAITQGAGSVAVTAPYKFYQSNRVGVSFSIPLSHADGVIGMDISLGDLSNLLSQHSPLQGAHIALVSHEGFFVTANGASSQRGGPKSIPKVFDELIKTFKHQATPLRVQFNDQYWQALSLQLDPQSTQSSYLLFMLPEQSILQGLSELIREQLVLIVLLLLLGVFLGAWFAKRLSISLEQLSSVADAVRHFRFQGRKEVRSSIQEVDNLARSLEQMSQTIADFLKVTEDIASTENVDVLLPDLIQATAAAARAQLGVIYLVEDSSKQLRPAALIASDGQTDFHGLNRIDSSNTALGINTALHDGHAVSHNVDRKLITGHLGLDTRVDVRYGLTIPLVNREQQPLGILYLASTKPFDLSRCRFVEYLSSYASISLETQELIAAQKSLFDAFVRLIAHAIDTKSPYTGGHCLRVPVLTQMLAEAACAETEGPFADFYLDEKRWEAVNLAAWLHDCGKVTTPEFVVDKATRLETIYDRIHEVRMRFEVLKKEQEVACWQRIAGGANQQMELKQLQTQWQELDDEFAFVAQCNSGETHMSDERVNRLKAICNRKWTRTLDDRLGLGIEESSRKAAVPKAPLPAKEALLADKPEHRIIHPEPVSYPPELNITMAPKEVLYDRGEIKNLTVQRGTLTEEERYKINEHIIQTLIMLNKLPFPKHLADVPEMAGGHHERVDGQGYPKGLKSEQMSTVAKMLAIADIYEALTASDRPYKPAKKVGEALNIMRNMAENGHIDADLLSLFIKADIPNRYSVKRPSTLNPA